PKASQNVCVAFIVLIECNEDFIIHFRNPQEASRRAGANARQSREDIKCREYWQANFHTSFSENIDVVWDYPGRYSVADALAAPALRLTLGLSACDPLHEFTRHLVLVSRVLQATR